jgi:hypothetical protein
MRAPALLGARDEHLKLAPVCPAACGTGISTATAFVSRAASELATATATSRWSDLGPAAVASDDRSQPHSISTGASALPGRRSSGGPSPRDLGAARRL